MKNYFKQIEDAEVKLKTLQAELKDAKKQTTAFLKKCAEYDITKVYIGVSPEEREWPFGGCGSVFTVGNAKAPSGDWPAIWGVVEELGISGGAGNTDQHQVRNENLIEGVYEVKNGNWRRVS